MIATPPRPILSLSISIRSIAHFPVSWPALLWTTPIFPG